MLTCTYRQAWSESCSRIIRSRPGILFEFDRKRSYLNSLLIGETGALSLLLNPMMALCLHQKCVDNGKHLGRTLSVFHNEKKYYILIRQIFPRLWKGVGEGGCWMMLSGKINRQKSKEVFFNPWLLGNLP